MRETSSRSSTSRTRCRLWRSRVSSTRSGPPGPPGPRRSAQQLQAADDRRQRVAQLVGQRGQKLVLAAVGLPQRLLHAHPLGDVGVGAEPAARPCRRRRGSAWRGRGTSGTRRRRQRSGKVSSQGSPRSTAARNSRVDPLDVVGVVDLLPAPALHLLEGGAGVVEPALVVPEDPAGGVGHPGELGDVVGQGAEASFALPPRLVALRLTAGPGNRAAVAHSTTVSKVTPARFRRSTRGMPRAEAGVSTPPARVPSALGAAPSSNVRTSSSADSASMRAEAP